MANNWPKVRVNDLAERVGMGPFGSSIKVETFVAEGVPVISGRHLNESRLDDSLGYDFVSTDHADRLKGANVRRGDIVFTHAGTIGQVAIVPANSLYERYVVSQRQFYLRCDVLKAVPEFIVAYFKTREGQHELLANSTPVGVPSIARPVTYLRQIAIPVPPLGVQQRIAEILGALDDKIALNRRMNETLEEIARTTYSEIVANDIEWPKHRLADLCETITSGGTPDTRVESYWTGNLPWLSSGETRNKFVVDTEKKISQEGVDESATRLARSGSTVIASAGQGHTRGQTSFLAIDTYINQSLVNIVANRSLVSDLFLFFNLERRYAEFRQLSDSSSSRGSLTTTILAQIQVRQPPKSDVANFDQCVEPLVEMILCNQRQSRTLAELRDTLLPKLISGELRVRDAEKTVSDAV